jgi:hypothetical protein
LVSGRGDGFALAERTAAWGVQTVPLFENKAASLARRRVHLEPVRVNRLGNMLEVFQHLPFPDSKSLGKLTQVERFKLEGFGNIFSQSGHFLSQKTFTTEFAEKTF